MPGVQEPASTTERAPHQPGPVSIKQEVEANGSASCRPWRAGWQLGRQADWETETVGYLQGCSPEGKHWEGRPGHTRDRGRRNRLQTPLRLCVVVFPGCPGTRSVDQAGLELRAPPTCLCQVRGLKAITARLTPIAKAHRSAGSVLTIFGTIGQASFGAAV